MYEITQYIGIGIIGSVIWVGFEMWRAPMMDEKTGKILKPGKKLSDLFKNKKESSGSYENLEKSHRGRSKY